MGTSISYLSLQPHEMTSDHQNKFTRVVSYYGELKFKLCTNQNLILQKFRNCWRKTGINKIGVLYHIGVDRQTCRPKYIKVPCGCKKSLRMCWLHEVGMGACRRILADCYLQPNRHRAICRFFAMVLLDCQPNFAWLPSSSKILYSRGINFERVVMLNNKDIVWKELHTHCALWMHASLLPCSLPHCWKYYDDAEMVILSGNTYRSQQGNKKSTSFKKIDVTIMHVLLVK